MLQSRHNRPDKEVSPAGLYLGQRSCSALVVLLRLTGYCRDVLC